VYGSFLVALVDQNENNILVIAYEKNNTYCEVVNKRILLCNLDSTSIFVINVKKIQKCFIERIKFCEISKYIHI